MESYEGSLIAATLANRAGKGTDAALIADAIVSTWQLIDTALSPIIGHGGVAALYKRSLYLTGRVHPWLVGPALTEQLLHSVWENFSAPPRTIGHHDN
jgi:hypothetical protein